MAKGISLQFGGENQRPQQMQGDMGSMFPIIAPHVPDKIKLSFEGLIPDRLIDHTEEDARHIRYVAELGSD